MIPIVSAARAMLGTSRGERKSAWARAPARRALISVAAFHCSSDAGIAPANLNMTRKPLSPRGGSAGAQLEVLNLVLRHMEFHEAQGVALSHSADKNDLADPDSRPGHLQKNLGKIVPQDMGTQASPRQLKITWG